MAAWRRRLVEVAAGLPTAAELGELVSGAVGSLVRHERLHLLGLDPASGTTSFSMGRDADGFLAVDQLCGYYLGHDPHRPSVLAGQPTPVRLLGSAGYPVLARHNVGSELRAVLREGGVAWGVLSLYRQEDDPCFDAEDVRRVLALSGPLVITLRSYVRAAPPRPVHAPPPPGVILVGADHTVRGVSPEADEWFRRLGPREPAIDPEVIAASLTREVQLAVRRPGRGGTARCCLPAAFAGHWVGVHAQRLDPEGVGDIAVTVGAATGEQFLTTLSAWHGITPRERVVLRQLSTGLAPKQIARLLDLSVHTVNDHLKSVFGKTGAHSRHELIAALNP